MWREKEAIKAADAKKKEKEKEKEKAAENGRKDNAKLKEVNGSSDAKSKEE